MKKTKLILFFKLTLSLILANANVSLARDIQFYTDDWFLPPYSSAKIARGSGTPKPLMPKAGLSATEQEIVEKAVTVTKKFPVLSLILIDSQDGIVYESYNNGAKFDSLLKGNSMSKSIVSVAVGTALCNGTISSLDDKASCYSKSLAGTAYGEASIRQLLMMASSGTIAKQHGLPRDGLNDEWAKTHKSTIRSAFQQFGIHQPNPSHLGQFSYKGLDTLAVSVAVADAAKMKFSAYLEKNVWKKIGAEMDALIWTDKAGDALGNAGFGAIPRDWARLAIFIREKSREQSCLGSYLRDATSGQIKTAGPTGGQFASYGYQFWTDNQMVSRPTAWLNGFDGQRIGIDLKSGKIIVLFSYELGAVKEIYRLFDDWISK